MNLIDKLNHIDTRLFLFLNGLHNSFFDFVMFYATERFFWIPFYILMAFFVVKKYKSRFLLILLVMIFLTALADQVSSHFVKTHFQRLRPCHNPSIANILHLVVKGCGGQYGFVSGHATNSFAIATFVTLLTRKTIPWMKWPFIIWAVLISYSRIYVGVHYPGDIFGGMILGTFLAFPVYLSYKWIEKKYSLSPEAE